MSLWERLIGAVCCEDEMRAYRFRPPFIVVSFTQSMGIGLAREAILMAVVIEAVGVT